MKRTTSHLPRTPITAHIEKLSHDGRGIARINGKITFIQNALPGETITCQLLRKKRDYDEGMMLSVIEPSPDRVEPKCPHFALCGGCSMQHLDGPSQIHEKQALLLDTLIKIGHVIPESVLPPLESSLWHYRNKARLSVRYVQKKQSVLVGFREKNKPSYITDIQTCPVLNARVDAQLLPLQKMLSSFETLDVIAQVELAAGDDEVALIFRNMAPLSLQDQEKLKLFAKASQFRIFLQPAGADSVTLFFPEDGNSFLSYRIPEENISLQFHPTDFTQVNAEINRKMVPLAIQLLDLKPEDHVLDLFCGLGNFSLPLAKHCANMVGVEGSQTMVLRAQRNAELNGITNASFQCLNLEEEGSLGRIKSQTFSKLLLDPPRMGAKAIVNDIHLLPLDRVVYVSCNPATLARDADILVHQKGFKLMSVRVMDMFPHTAHVESMAVFRRISAHG